MGERIACAIACEEDWIAVQPWDRGNGVRVRAMALGRQCNTYLDEPSAIQLAYDLLEPLGYELEVQG